MVILGKAELAGEVPAHLEIHKFMGNISSAATHMRDWAADLLDVHPQ